MVSNTPGFAISCWTSCTFGKEHPFCVMNEQQPYRNSLSLHKCMLSWRMPVKGSQLGSHSTVVTFYSFWMITNIVQALHVVFHLQDATLASHLSAFTKDRAWIRTGGTELWSYHQNHWPCFLLNGLCRQWGLPSLLREIAAQASAAKCSVVLLF